MWVHLLRYKWHLTDNFNFDELLLVFVSKCEGMVILNDVSIPIKYVVIEINVNIIVKMI